jgi:hypothetical protein
MRCNRRQNVSPVKRCAHLRQKIQAIGYLDQLIRCRPFRNECQQPIIGRDKAMGADLSKYDSSICTDAWVDDCHVNCVRRKA